MQGLSYKVLFILYTCELATLFTAAVYVVYSWLNRKKELNPHLKGNRMKAGFLLPFIWLFYIGADCYHTYLLSELLNWEIPASIYWDKAFREGVSLVGGLLTSLFIIGYKFGEK